MLYITVCRVEVMLFLDKESMFRWGRSPWPPFKGRSPNDRASPPHHTPLQLVSSFCCFPTTVYLQPDPLFISWERRSGPPCMLPLQLYLLLRALAYHHTSMFRETSRHHHMILGSPSFVAHLVYSSHMSFCVSSSSSSEVKYFHFTLKPLCVFLQL